MTATPRLGISIIITGGVTMTEFLSALGQPFMLRALIVGVVISICAALLGVILVLKRYALIGHGLADIGFASLSLAIALGWSPLYVSMPIVAAASFAIGNSTEKSRVITTDTEPGDPPYRLTDYYNLQNEYATAPQATLRLGLRYHFNHGIYAEVQGSYTRGFNLHYIDGSSRWNETIKLGYTF